VVDAEDRTNPRLYAVGAARRGTEWEVAAVPDLRQQAARLATHLRATQGLTGRGIRSDQVRPA
jgi:uncharacterized NAD(P)/FAD-binding protein YdhS